MTFTKSIPTILTEAAVIGAGVMAFGAAGMAITSPDLAPAQRNKILLAMFIGGAAFHVALEYTGLNAWYSNKYVALQQEKKSAGIEKAKEELERKIMDIPGVWGIGTTGYGYDRRIEIAVASAQQKDKIKSLIQGSTYNGFPVDVVIREKTVALFNPLTP